MDIKPMQDRKRYSGGLIAAAALMATFLLWQVSDLSTLVYPFRLFVTLVHELGHGMAAILTGGRFVELLVMRNGAGLARYSGGSGFVVIQAGYLGAALFGSALLMLANRVRDPRPLTAAVGLFCGGTAVLLGANLWTRAVGVVILLAMLVLVWETPARLKNAVDRSGSVLGRVFSTILKWRGPLWLNLFALNLLAMMVSLNAVLDILWLLNSLEVYVPQGDRKIPNDAAAMAELTKLPAPLWAIFWIVLSVLMLLGAVHVTFIRPLRRAQSE